MTMTKKSKLNFGKYRDGADRMVKIYITEI